MTISQSSLQMALANPQSIDMSTKIAIIENFLYIVDKEAQLRLLVLNEAQRELVRQWTHRMLLVKSRQEGISTFVLGLFFVEALLIPGLVVAVISHEEYATTRLLDKIDIFHKHLPPDLKMPMKNDSKYEKKFSNGSTIYIGTAGQRAFGRGDTIHRALVSEEAHYENAERILGGLAEAVPMSGYLVRESTPLGDSGHYYESVQTALDGKGVYKLIPLYWWFGQDYTLPKDSELIVIPEDRKSPLDFSEREATLMIDHNLTEDQVRWMRWKIQAMRSEKSGSESLFPQEYISDLETCFLGPADKVFAKVDAELQAWATKAREPLMRDEELEIWKLPEPGGRYVLWVDPCGGDSVSDHDPHEGVILRSGVGGAEHVASFSTGTLGQKALAFKVVAWAKKYNDALLVIERNGVGIGVLNYVKDTAYRNIYMEKKPNGELSGKYGWNTDRINKTSMVSDAIEAIKNETAVSYDRKLVRQLRALVNKDGKVAAKPPARDDRAMAFMGALEVTPEIPAQQLVVGDYVTFNTSQSSLLMAR